MNLKFTRVFSVLAGAVLAATFVAGAQTAPAPAPAAAPAAAPVWSLGAVDFSGFVDGYYSYNANNPGEYSSYGKINQLYNFDDATGFSLAAAKFSLNHDPDPVGVHVDFLFGRTNALINGNSDYSYDNDNFLEQAYLSVKPAKAKGLELDFGKFVTSAGAEVIESKDNWNYSRSLLFVNAIPYYHFGLRSSYPVTKTWTAGLQVVNGWNNTVGYNGGVTIGVTSVLTKTKYTWSANLYSGPSSYNTQKGYKNLIDTTLLLTPTAKFNAYINYDYGQNRNSTSASYPSSANKVLNHWQGVAVAAREQVTGKAALAARYEYFKDPQGFQTGGYIRPLQEVTATYEYKWVQGLLARIEYRRDWSDQKGKFFTKGNTYDKVNAQDTLTLGVVAFFGPKR
jgi:hypothetical protein